MYIVLAQFARQWNNPNDVGNKAFLAGMLIFVIIFLAIFLGVYIAYLLTLQKALGRCSRRNRTMEPGLVWLNLIPLFHIVWQFITVIRVSESLDNEFYDRRKRGGGDFGKSIGITYCVLGLTGIIPIIGPVLSLAALVCFIIYWVKIAGLSKRLAEDYDRGDDDDFPDDEPPRRRGRRDSYDDERDDDRPPRKKRDNDYDDTHDDR